jgi:hypothetical protein
MSTSMATARIFTCPAARYSRVSPDILFEVYVYAHDLLAPSCLPTARSSPKNTKKSPLASSLAFAGVCSFKICRVRLGLPTYMCFYTEIAIFFDFFTCVLANL